MPFSAEAKSGTGNSIVSRAALDLKLLGLRQAAEELQVGLDRNDLSSNRHPALHYWWSMTPAFAGAGLFRKPVSTFRDHALITAGNRTGRRHQAGEPKGKPS